MTAVGGRPWQGAASADSNLDTAIVGLRADNGSTSDSASVQPPAQVLPHHRQLLAASGIPLEFAVEHGVRSVVSPAELPPPLQWSPAHGALPGLLFPWRGPARQTDYQLRPDRPVHLGDDPEPRKYLQPSAVRLIDVLGDPAEASEVWFVEGTRQHLAAAAYAPAHVIGIPGCANALKDGLLLPGLSELVEDRHCVVLFDADLASNPTSGWPRSGWGRRWSWRAPARCGTPGCPARASTASMTCSASGRPPRAPDCSPAW